MAQYDTTWFEKGLAELEITLNEKQIEQFLTYYELLVEWNKVMNLTAITEYEEVINKHFLDSVASVKVCDYSKPMVSPESALSTEEPKTTHVMQTTENSSICVSHVL